MAEIMCSAVELLNRLYKDFVVESQKYPKVSLDATDLDSGHPLNAQILQRDLDVDASPSLSNAVPVSMIWARFGHQAEIPPLIHLLPQAYALD